MGIETGKRRGRRQVGARVESLEGRSLLSHVVPGVVGTSALVHTLKARTKLIAFRATGTAGYSVVPTADPATVDVVISGSGTSKALGPFTATATYPVGVSALTTYLLSKSRAPLTLSGVPFQATFAGGTITGTLSGTSRLQGNGTYSLIVRGVIRGGTGLYAGAAGKFSSTGRFNATTGSIGGPISGTLVLPR